MLSADKARQLNAEGLAAREAGDEAKAIELYRQACIQDPKWSVPYFNLGLIYKYQGQWRESLHCNTQAAAIDPEDEAALWNLGIAATALGEWQLARDAWRRFGLKVPDGVGPLDMPCGQTPIRLNPDTEPEVVWCTRLDPARAEIDNIPFVQSGHCFGDVVLNDGAPNGYRELDGTEVPVFDALELLQRSAFGTYVIRMESSALFHEPDWPTRVADSLGAIVEDWTTSVRYLCRQCSEGRPHAQHDRDAALNEHEHRLAIAAKGRAHAEAVLKAWQKLDPGALVEWQEEFLEPEFVH